MRRRDRGPRSATHRVAGRWTALVVLLAFAANALTGCAAMRTGTTTTPAKRAATPEACAPDATLPSELSAPGSVVLFGELHGVKELPWFFGEVACSTARAGRPVAVGLEIPAA